MNVRYLLGIALGAATIVAACGGEPTDTLGLGQPDPGGETGDPGSSNNSGSKKTGGNNTPSTGNDSTTIPSGQSTPSDTNTPAGAKFFQENVHAGIGQQCGGCHQANGPGPQWYSTDVTQSYNMMFQRGYVTLQSRILLKGPHTGGAPAISSENQAKFTQWVQMELSAGGQKGQTNVLEKLGKDCMDQTLFNAIGLQNLRTTRRTNNNNTNNVTPWNENANNCTGCDNAPCRTCHSGDDATNFVLALGNPNLPANYTFEQTKLTNPAYLQKYFGLSPTGEPIASNGVDVKALATQKDRAYSHPMFTLTAAQKTAIDAFVADAVGKYKAGTCGKQ